MKKIFTIAILALSANLAQAADKADFFNAAPDMWELLSYEDIFYDDLTEERIYKVNYTYVVIEDCASSGEVDYCGPADVEGALAATCEYFIEDLHFNTLTASGISCDQDIEEVLGSPILIDEL